MEKQDSGNFPAIFEYGATLVHDPIAVTSLIAKGFGCMLLRNPTFIAKVLSKISKKKSRKSATLASPTNRKSDSLFGSPAIEENGSNKANDDESAIEGGVMDQNFTSTDVVMDEDVADIAQDLDGNDHEDLLAEARIINEEIPFISEEDDATVISPIILLSEEAFFLASNNLLSISIAEEPNKPLSLDDLWTLFYQLNPSFPIFYFVYNHFRSRKWIIRNGFNFGMDYCLYRDLPGNVHSEICVRVINSISKLVITQSNDQLNQSDLSYRRSECAWKTVQDEETAFTWRNLSTITRIMPDVMKLGLLCCVLSLDDTTMSNATGQTSTAANDSFKYAHLFDVKEESSISQSSASAAAVDVTNRPFIDFSTPACLGQLLIHPVTVMTRRHCIGSEKAYPTVTSIQQRFLLRKGSAAKPESVVSNKAKQSKQSSIVDHSLVQEDIKTDKEDPPVAVDELVPSLSQKAADKDSDPTVVGGKKRTAEEISSKVLLKKAHKRRDIDEVRTKKIKNETIWHVLAASAAESNSDQE